MQRKNRQQPIQSIPIQKYDDQDLRNGEILEENGIVYLEDIDEDNTRAMSALMKTLHRMAVNPNIEFIQLYINCSGGPVTDSFALYDHIKNIQKNYGKKIITVAAGACYSAACLILQAGERRASYANTEFMIHDLQVSELAGSLSDINHYVQILERNRKKMCNILGSKRTKFTPKEIMDIITGNKEYWLNSQQALAKGLIDEIIK